MRAAARAGRKVLRSARLDAGCLLRTLRGGARCAVRGPQSPIQCTCMRRGIVSWRKLANDAARPQPWSSLTV